MDLPINGAALTNADLTRYRDWILEKNRDLELQSFGSSALQLSIDTGHAHYAHGTNGAPPVDYYVEAAAEKLAHVHLQDADGYADRHWLPGEGDVNWHAIFRSLGRLNSDPRLIIEVKDQVNLRRGADHLVNLGLAI